MGKTLIIAEKPKVANEILKLSRFQGSHRKQGSKSYYGYYENEKYIVTWCRGHLLGVMNPEDHDPKYKQFRFEDLPIFLPTTYQPIKDSKEQLNFVVELMKRSDVEHVVNATDNDREGELIFREIYEYAGINKKVSRIFKSSHETEELEAAFNALLPGEQFDSLANAAKARQYMDHLLGITITRASTTKLAKNQLLLSSGRIQMCLLAEIRKRELEVKNFKEQTFYTLEIGTQKDINALYKTDQQFLNPEPLKKHGEWLKGNHVTVKQYEDKESKSSPKNLFNLTDIYKEAIKKFNANTTVVQKHIQHLYDSGYITYPRSDSRFLPVSRLEKVRAAYHQLKDNEKYKDLTTLVDPAVITEKHSAFNDNKVTAHYAIVPTTKKYEGTERPELEVKLYDLIVRRFLGRFMPAAVYQVRKIVLVDVNGEEYHAQEKILKDPGYLKIFKEEIEEDTKQDFTLSQVQEGERLLVENYSLKEGKTRRPSLHNESTILSFMENAGKYIEDEDVSKLLKRKRIGTTATEHSFLPKLLERSFIQVDSQGRFTTTSIGSRFIDAFPVEELKNPEFTAELEGGVESIKDNEDSLENFISKSQELAKLIVQKMSEIPEEVPDVLISKYNEQIEICSCLCKEGKLIDKGNFYGCSRYPDCNITFPKKLKEKIIPVSQVQKLFEKGSTDLLKGFKNDDISFDAFLIIEENKFKFRFPTVDDKSLGNCPKCKNGKVIPIETKEGKKFFACSEYKNGCNFSFPHSILGVKLPISQVKKYLKEGRTDFINGFVSKNDKEFTAALIMNSDYGFEFKMPTKEDRTLGKCRLCEGNVLVGKHNYFCENYKKTCEFILPGEFLGKTISSVQATKLLKDNMTDLIKGFKKKDNTGTFDAKLSYSTEEKRIKFIFPQKKL
ncbi:MAG: DNA topoisomerase [Bacillota bacterium]|nr:DNA topoisomerase [Bacillota bacterium]